MKLVVFGAGNIGRSFVGQLFARAGYQVVFVDVDDTLVAALNREGRYRIEIKDRNPETIWVEGISAIHGADRTRVAAELAQADLAATAVGAKALPYIYPTLAAGLRRRRELGAPPLDLIICENLRNAADVFMQGLHANLPANFPLVDSIGLIETSIGKMVPIMPDEIRHSDPLLLYAEAYNTLILDAKAFKNPLPEVPGLDPKQNMAAYVDRKAFIHNCGHAACAYFGYLAHPATVYLYEVISDPKILEAGRNVMWESARALIRRYPDEFNENNQHAHIEDLLSRFANRSLGDTVFRVGRDLPRKLSRKDRMIGALLMDAEQAVPSPATTYATAAAIKFKATDEHAKLFPADEQFHHDLAEYGLAWALSHVCGLNPEIPAEAIIANEIETLYRKL